MFVFFFPFFWCFCFWRHHVWWIVAMMLLIKVNHIRLGNQSWLTRPPLALQGTPSSVRFSLLRFPASSCTPVFTVSITGSAAEASALFLTLAAHNGWIYSYFLPCVCVCYRWPQACISFPRESRSALRVWKQRFRSSGGEIKRPDVGVRACARLWPAFKMAALPWSCWQDPSWQPDTAVWEECVRHTRLLCLNVSVKQPSSGRNTWNKNQLCDYSGFDVQAGSVLPVAMAARIWDNR